MVIPFEEKKSDFLRCFIAFHKLVEKQIGKSVKIFQSDGGGEFSKKEFLDYLSDHGIAHRLSCPGTPEQNGVAKRKHRHIVELGLAMLYQASEPKRFWVEAFATSVFLINRLPSSQLKMGCPYNELFNEDPVYSCMQVFGCLCFPYL